MDPHELLAEVEPLLRYRACQMARPSGVPFEDLFQEAAVAILKAAHRYDPHRGRPDVWAWDVARCAMSRAIDRHTRGLIARTGASFDHTDGPDAALTHHAAPNQEPADEAHAGSEALRLRDAVATLPAALRTLVARVHGLDGQSPAGSVSDAARQLQISRNTAKTQYARALAALKVALTVPSGAQPPDRPPPASGTN